MAPRANWKGYLKLSLVSCAVSLFPASSSTARVSFNTINRQTGNKVKRQFVDSVTGEVVDTENQAKGYAVAKDRYMLIEDAELDAIKIESTHTIEIEKFVPRAEIDPRYFEAPYYIAPNERVAEEAFSIMRDAMEEKKVVGLARVVIARRERVMMLEPMGRGIAGTVLRYAYEVRGDEAYFDEIPDLKLPKELKDLAYVIIERMSGHFKPDEFNDRYEDAVVAMVRNKQAGLPPEPVEEPTQPGNVINIMDALKKSIAAAGAGKGAKAVKEEEVVAEAAAPAPKPKAASKTKAAKPATPAKARKAAR
jgi:DNA end-binding protein Ku